MAWSKQQLAAIEAFKEGRNICITGPAGTGKSKLIEHFKEQKSKGLYVTAASGLAASLVGGTTLHSWASIGTGAGDAKMLAKKIRGTAADRWKRTRVLIIDEASMIAADLFEKLDFIARRVRKVDEPFGGIQLVMVADFLQLPPVLSGKKHVAVFCFESEAWQKADIQIIRLEQVFRQNDGKFLQALNEIRRGVELSAASRQLLKECEERKLATVNGIVPTMLFCRRMQVDGQNKDELAKLPGVTIRITARDTGDAYKLEKCRFLKSIDLKAGAQVMYLRNSPEFSLVNGSRGIVTDISKGFPVVRFENGVEIQVGRAQETFEEDGKVVACRCQVPLCLAWALTVHKAQGMTLDRANVDLSGSFECGQVYVALSRVRSAEGLALRGFEPAKIRAHGNALKFYQELEEREKEEEGVEIVQD